MSGTVELAPAQAQRLETRGKARSFVAIKTATVRNEYGQEETVTAGVTFIHDARHFLVTEYPHLFAREGSTRAKAAPRRRTAARAASPAAPAKRPMWKPLVRLDTRAAPTFTAHLTDKAYLAMTGLAFGERGELETGGPLFGLLADDAMVKVRRAEAPGPKARTSRDAMLPDREDIRRQAIALERDTTLDRWVGFWHTHPSMNGEPSRKDLAYFAWDCREWHHFGRSPTNYVGLILTPRWDQDRHSCESYLSWAKPTFHAWHMRAVSDDQFICTRAKVERC